MTYDSSLGTLTLVETTGGEIATSDITTTGSWFQGAIINHLLRRISVTGSACYLSLYGYNTANVAPPNPGTPGRGGIASVPLGGGGGLIPPTTVPEISGSTGYKRISMTGKFTVYGTSSACAINNSDLMFTTATSDWGNVTHFALTNGSEAGGNSGCVLFYGPLSSSRIITRGDTFVILFGDLRIQMSGGIPYASGSRILDHYLNNVPYTPPSGSNITCALYSIPPGADGTGGTEISGGGYSRQLAGSAVLWADPFTQTAFPGIPTGGGITGGQIDIPTGKLYTSNGCPIIFSYSAGTDWGLIKYFALWDTFSGTKLIYRGIVDPAVTVIAPDGFMFNTRSINIFPDSGRSEVT